MAGPPGALLDSIGESLRSIREQRGFTLDQAAEISGLSKSHLSRLESSERLPSIAALLALSEAFGVSVGSLLGEKQGGVPMIVSRPDTPRRESNGLSIASCSGFSGSNVIDALRVTVNPGREDMPPARHHGEEWLYVVSGTLRLAYDGEVHYLEAGCSAHFDAELPHTLGTESGPVEVLLVAAKNISHVHAIH